MGDLHRMTEGELAGAIDALLAKAGRVSPPRNIVEAEEQAAALLQLARVRDELHRRARARAGLVPLAGGCVSTVENRQRAGARRAAGARAVLARPPTEDQVDTAIARLEALAQRARDNLLRQGRDPGRARVAITWLQQELGVHGARWRALLSALEGRNLVRVLDGGYVETWRAAA